jgi:peptidoglycan/xylan/chitin deacetylase (PgdA/CDA1 family)
MGCEFFRHRYILIMRSLLRHIYLNFASTIKSVKPGIHIINSHYINSDVLNQKKDYQTFEEYLQYLQGLGRLINVEEATNKIFNKNIPKDELQIAFTFDDGYEECYTVIAPLLEKYGCRGAFFINANYIDSSEAYQTEFNKRVANSSKNPMTWHQVIDLHKRGHLIGSHNLDHSNFAELGVEDIEYQLKKNKEILEQKLNYNCEYFAWTYGQLQHMPLEALEITEKYHKYIFSGTNYKQYFSFDGRVINRRHQEASWPQSHIKYFLSSKKDYNFTK